MTGLQSEKILKLRLTVMKMNHTALIAALSFTKQKYSQSAIRPMLKDFCRMVFVRKRTTRNIHSSVHFLFHCNPTNFTKRSLIS